jgi:hypothetical protein
MVARRVLFVFYFERTGPDAIGVFLPLQSQTRGDQEGVIWLGAGRSQVQILSPRLAGCWTLGRAGGGWGCGIWLW